ncbi:MAG TPA: APC family permease [Candidatus Sulfotelmatobacter sp.]|nr:APC family permease [Candidatus Sulfotelmatobacter sp.]
MSAPSPNTPKPQLPRVMGVWDVLLFNIATVLGPRWIASAAHNGTSSITLWILAAAFFFVPTAMVITELSTRFPEVGGLYAWTKDAFGEFHGFVAGWNYWVYTLFYFPALLFASASMAAYIGGIGYAPLAQNQKFLLAGSFVLLTVAVYLNIIGLRIGKWLQNVGGVSTFLPLTVLVLVAALIWTRQGSVTHFTWTNVLPHWDWDTVNYWPQIAFAFAGLELVSTMSEEVRDPKKTFPRAILGSGIVIAILYIAGTVAVLALMSGVEVDPKSGVFEALTIASGILKFSALGMIAAMLVTVGNAGGVGSTVAGIARVPFAVGLDRYLPPAFGRIHPKWETPYVSILTQAIISGLILLLSQINETTVSAYQILVAATNILYFIPFLYMYAAAIRLAYRADREAAPGAVLIPGGKAGVWAAAGLGFAVSAAAIALSLVPPGDAVNKFQFELKLVGGTGFAFLLGTALYYRGARAKERADLQISAGAASRQ